MNKNILIAGAGEHAFVIKEIIESLGEYSKIDFLDDKSDIAIGKLSDMSTLRDGYDYLFCSIGNNKFRKLILETAEKFDFIIPTLVHKSAYVSKSAKVGKGCLIAMNAVVNSNSFVGDGCFISAGAVIDHNVYIGDYVHINAGVVLYSSSIVEDGTKISCDEKIYRIEKQTDSAMTGYGG